MEEPPTTSLRFPPRLKFPQLAKTTSLNSPLAAFISDRHRLPPLSPQPNPPNQTKKKPKKPPYKPPSSLDRSGQSPLRSDLPFDFRFSYTESSSNVKPIGLREPKYSPFGPGRVDRSWTGFAAPAVDPTVRSVEVGPAKEAAEERWRAAREKVLGEPLTQAERAMLIDKCQKHRTKRQVNLGRDGLTHNMLNDIHNSWKNAEAVRIKCLGVPTVDMKNVCTQLEEKTGGLVIHRHGGQIILYRGRHYNPKKRPVIPLMLWKPHEPVYPKLIKTTIDGLTIEETKDMRKRGLAVPALIKLAKNGYYASLVPMVRDAFLVDELVRIDCKGLPRSDYKKIGVKLRDLVPCVLVTFDKEQIVMWRGKDYCSTSPKSDAQTFFTVVANSEDSTMEKSDTDILNEGSDDQSVVSDTSIPELIV
ncbi:LOW QUALITY PROTEIN: CRS2-associated factor 1, mitochondrial-like [Asparagus officinalis]|uniref:LOW QUALITY PROTEIN: CRS2-associated factor 1, mitochondrial-like n=1 Tax=Asparagus officinalis TaxID=4686 RepID=UPI00098E1ACB|nr:LOW QUALITY PROTEIN: CRS2-associated factor 1, mitochondrial-like [Asparagus officinalis]